MKYLTLYEAFDHSEPYHNVLKDKMIRLINTGYNLEEGDRVYNNIEHSKYKGEFGTVITIHEKDWRKTNEPHHAGKPYIKWDGADKVDEHPTSIQYGGMGAFNYNIMKEDVLDEYEKIKKEYLELISVSKRLDMESVISDMRNNMTEDDLKSKHELSDNEYRYIIDSPEVRYSFS